MKTTERQNSLESHPATNGMGVTPRLHNIDILRAFACGAVFLFHLHLFWLHGGTSNYPILDALASPLTWGYVGVHAFLALSGFCLYYPIARRKNQGNHDFGLKEYAYRRAKRILPPYYAALILFTALAFNEQYSVYTQSIRGAMRFGFDFVTHILLIHNLFARTMPSINGAFWSLALEAHLYVLFPLLLLATRRAGIRGVALGCFLVSVTWQFIVLKFFLSHALLNYEPHFLFDSVVGRCFEFVLGMASASIVARGLVPQWRLRASVTLVFAFGIAVALTTIYGKVPLRDQAWGITFASLLVLTSGWFQTKTDMQEAQPRFLSKARAFVINALLFLGGVSYSVYLLHQPLLILSSRFINLHGNKLLLILSVVALLTTILALSIAFFFLFERPFMNSRGSAYDARRDYLIDRIRTFGRQRPV